MDEEQLEVLLIEYPVEDKWAKSPTPIIQRWNKTANHARLRETKQEPHRNQQCQCQWLTSPGLWGVRDGLALELRIHEGEGPFCTVHISEYIN